MLGNAQYPADTPRAAGGPSAPSEVPGSSQVPGSAYPVLAEVAARYGDLVLSPADLVSQVPRLGIVLEPVTAEDAVLQADVRARDVLGNDGRPHLSLSDRLCLALALRLDLPVLTADRAWDRLDLPVSVTQLR